MYPDAPLVQRNGEVNAWDNAEFRDAIRAANKSQIIMAGIVTDVCESGPFFLVPSLSPVSSSPREQGVSPPPAPGRAPQVAYLD